MNNYEKRLFINYFDKMLDDAGRKAGLIDAPTDPTKPIGISDSEVADIMTKLTGGNKTVI